MADQDSTSNGNGSGPESAPQIAVLTQYIKDLSVESPNSPAVFQWQAQPQVDVQFNINVNNVSEEVHEVILKVNVAARSDNGAHFLIDLSYAGLIGLRNLPEDAVYGYDEWDRLKQNKQVQAVYVVTPNAVHRDNVVAASGAGKHVLCEKPMAVSSPECREMIEACAKAGMKLMIAYRCQYEPFNRALTKAVRGGSLGKARLIQAFNGQTTGLPEQWRLKKVLSGGGALPDIGLYCLNGTRALLGEEPDSVQAIAYSPPDDPKFKEVEETITFTLRFPSGTIAQCIASYGVHESRALTVHTQAGAFDLQNAFAYRGQRLFVGRAEGKNEARDEKILAHKNQFALEIDHFSRCIQENLKPRTPGEEGLQDQILMEAIYESARTGAPVKTGPLPGTGSGVDATRGPEPEEAG